MRSRANFGPFNPSIVRLLQFCCWWKLEKVTPLLYFRNSVCNHDRCVVQADKVHEEYFSLKNVGPLTSPPWTSVQPSYTVLRLHCWYSKRFRLIASITGAERGVPTILRAHLCSSAPCGATYAHWRQPAAAAAAGADAASRDGCRNLSQQADDITHLYLALTAALYI